MSLDGTERSSTLKRGLPVSRSKRKSRPNLVVCATASILRPLRFTVTRLAGRGRFWTLVARCPQDNQVLEYDSGSCHLVRHSADIPAQTLGEIDSSLLTKVRDELARFGIQGHQLWTRSK